jgi:general secretion pathway protein A
VADSPLSFCGYRENPFCVNPDPRFLFWANHVERAFGGIVLGIRDRAGLILITGEAGTGKTTLLYRLIDSLRPSETPVAFIFNSKVEAGDLWRLMFAEFRLSWMNESEENRRRRFCEWLLEEYRAERAPVLIIDEAQGLSLEVLGELQSLLDLTSQGHSLLQIVLSGQTEFEEMLKRRELQVFRERVTVWQRTRPLNLDETDSYIRHRASLAGAGTGVADIFDEPAIRAIHEYSQGIPRLINLVSERSLRDGHSRNLFPVPADLVHKAAHDFQLDDVKSAPAVRQPFLAIPMQGLGESAGVTRSVEKAESVPGIDLTIQQVEALLADFRRHQKMQQARAIQAAARAASAPLVSRAFSAAPPPEAHADASPALKHARNRAIRVAAVLRSKTREAIAPLTKIRKRKPQAQLWKGRPEQALKALGHFLTNPMPRFRYGTEIFDRGNRFCEFSFRMAPERTAALREVLAELAADLQYLPEESLKIIRVLFRGLEFVPNWILSPRWKERCTTAWGRHRQTYDSLIHWLRGPLPF